MVPCFGRGFECGLVDGPWIYGLYVFVAPSIVAIEFLLAKLGKTIIAAACCETSGANERSAL